MSRSILFQLSLVLAVITAVKCSNRCAKLQKNVDLILSIGPWSSSMMVVTTNLHTFSSVQLSDSTLTLGDSVPLSSKYASLSSQLKKGSVKSSDNLIQVSGSNVLLYSGSGGSWSLPLTGESGSTPVTVDSSIQSAVWASNDNGMEVLSINNGAVQYCTFSSGKLSINNGNRKFICPVGSKVKITTSCTTGSWPIKKAFRFAGNYYFLTADSVHIFKADTGNNETPLTTVKLENFFKCTGGDDDSDNDVIDDGKGGHISKTIIIVVAIIGLLLLLLIIVIVLCACRPKKDKKGRSGASAGGDGGNNGTNSSKSKRNRKKDSHHHTAGATPFKKSSKNRSHRSSRRNNIAAPSKSHRRSQHPTAGRNSHHGHQTLKRNASSGTMHAKTGTNRPKRSTSQNTVSAGGRNTPSDQIQKKYKVTPMSSQVPTHWSTTRKKQNK